MKMLFRRAFPDFSCKIYRKVILALHQPKILANNLRGHMIYGVPII